MLLKFTPLWEVVRKVLTGRGECSEVNWRFLGLTMPAWVLIWALLLGAVGVAANSRPARTGPQFRTTPRTGASG